MVRAIAWAHHSRWPPPMICHWFTADTSILAPGSRGVEPSALTTVTSTGISPRANRRSACSIQSNMGVLAANNRYRVQNGFRRGGRIQLGLAGIIGEAGHRVPDSVEHAEGQQQRGLAHGLGPINTIEPKSTRLNSRH